MEKLSGILPASARTRVAEVSSSQPARPGAPLLGRPMGKNSLGDRITLSKQLEAMRESGQLPEPESAPVYKDTTENRKLKVIQDLNNKFFMNPKAEVRDDDLAQSEDTLKKTTNNESLFYVEPELKPQEAPLAPVK